MFQAEAAYNSLVQELKLPAKVFAVDLEVEQLNRIDQTGLP